ncbi:hypothetical protein ACFY9C_11440 [Streptomyces filamentosus]|uniref:hypothetical protein n=1 Tax=Streptomyces filamentosus TaxID=67294 RepID=UPI0036E22026
MLSDDDVLAAVRRDLKEGGASGAAFPAQGARVTRHLLVEGEIVRCVETREEAPRFRQGSVDLSGRPEYEDLARHRVPAPRDPAVASTLKLVRRGSVDARLCTCGNGRVRCERCHGAGDLACRKYVPCERCRGLDSCLDCDGTGRRARKADRPKPDEETAERVGCRKCGAAGAACAGCRGSGRERCAECGGSGSRPCPDCGETGTVPHDHCGGTGRYVRWTEGVIARKPLVDAIRESSSLPDRSFGWADRPGDWTRVEAEGPAAVPGDDADADLVAWLEPRLQPHAGEVGRRVSLRHLTLARVTHADHPHRVYYVIAGPDGPRVLSRRSPRRKRQYAAAAFLLLALLATAAVLLT